jgi:transcriptional regulator with XRE-family HTH domain
LSEATTMADHQFKGRQPVRPGAALKALRLERGWSLAELSSRTGMPVSSLSKVENDKMQLTLEKLIRVSVALEVDPAGLFAPPSGQFTHKEASGRRSITRKGEGKAVDSAIGSYRYLAHDLLNKRAVPLTLDVTARSLEAFGEFNRHAGEEMIYVLEGELELYTDTYVATHLKAGDSIYFDSDMGHAYVAVGEGPCRILSICIPPEADLIRLLEMKGAPHEVLTGLGANRRSE